MKKTLVLAAAVLLTLSACGQDTTTESAPQATETASEVISKPTRMPSFEGMTVVEVEAGMDETGIKDYSFSSAVADKPAGDWEVMEQFPKAGTPLAEVGDVTFIVVENEESTGVGTSVPSPDPFSITFDCGSYENRRTFTSLQQVWDKTSDGDELDCTAELSASGEASDTELKALKKAYGADADLDSLEILYSICTQMTGIPIEGTLNEGQASEMAGAFILCPDHPKSKKIKDSIVMGMEAEKEQAAIDKDRENGKFVGPGSYLVGTDVVAGTWQSQGDRVTDCYWETSDASGNIIANNFISVAPRFTITVPPGASGLTVEGCSFRWVGP